MKSIAMKDIDSLVFAENGLIPAIVQDYRTGKVLMMAYMNRESLAISLQENRTCFYSRSRGELWRKGETSGNYQDIVSIKADCDKDTLLVEVIPVGPACHTGSESCFFNDLHEGITPEEQFSYEGLYQMLVGRKEAPKEGSYTSYLFEKGVDKILKKIGEECTEVVIAAKGGDNEETVFEISDLLYHLTVLMVNNGITLDMVTAELAKRHIVDHKVKQEKMQ